MRWVKPDISPAAPNPWLLDLLNCNFPAIQPEWLLGEASSESFLGRKKRRQEIRAPLKETGFNLVLLNPNPTDFDVSIPAKCGDEGPIVNNNKARGTRLTQHKPLVYVGQSEPFQFFLFGFLSRQLPGTGSRTQFAVQQLLEVLTLQAQKRGCRTSAKAQKGRLWLSPLLVLLRGRFHPYSVSTGSVGNTEEQRRFGGLEVFVLWDPV